MIWFTSMFGSCRMKRRGNLIIHGVLAKRRASTSRNSPKLPVSGRMNDINVASIIWIPEGETRNDERQQILWNFIRWCFKYCTWKVSCNTESFSDSFVHVIIHFETKFNQNMTSLIKIPSQTPRVTFSIKSCNFVTSYHFEIDRNCYHPTTINAVLNI